MTLNATFIVLAFELKLHDLIWIPQAIQKKLVNFWGLMITQSLLHYVMNNYVNQRSDYMFIVMGSETTSIHKG